MDSDGPVRWGSGVARGVLATTVIGAGMAMLDSTIVNVALPRIGKELAASVSGLQWILDGYLLSLSALILIAGSLGDRYGRRRVYLIGVVWFGVASLLCGLAPDIELLVAARILQGIGGALLTPGSLAILQSSFARPDRARAIGAWSGFSGIAAAIGPLVGGLLVQAWSWRLAFLVNLPFAALCVWLARRYVPESCDHQRHGRPAIGSACLGAVGLAGVTSALVEAPVRGAADPIVIIAGALGVSGLVAFVLVQVRSPRPLVPPILFADRTFVLANALTFVVYTALAGVLMLMVLQLQVSLGYSPMTAGLAGMPITIIMLLLSAASGRLAQWIGPRAQLIGGPLVLAVGFLLLTGVRPGVSYLGGVLPGVLVFGLGLAAVVAPVTAAVLAAAADRYAGIASGVNNAIARTGGLLAVAVLPTVAGLAGAAYTDPIALTAAWRIVLWVCAALAVVGGLLAIGVRNDVLRAPAELAMPRVHCGVEGPPTHARPE